jgi:hypothetical protein
MGFLARFRRDARRDDPMRQMVADEVRQMVADEAPRPTPVAVAPRPTPVAVAAPRLTPVADVPQQEPIAEVLEAPAHDDRELIELEIVGESFHQDAFAAIAGPKEAEGKRQRVGVTLRCEPDNEYDSNAIRVEVMGQPLGHVSRKTAALLSPAMQRSCGGALEAVGMIVGGWAALILNDDGTDRVSIGHYGVRVWIMHRDADRLGVRPDDLDSSLRAPWPQPPVVTKGERRLSPNEQDAEDAKYGANVTVTGEEHYQDVIETSMPAGWSPNRTWPLLVDLVIAPSNPHTKHGTPCIEVRHGTSTIGYMTPNMTARHADVIESCVRDGLRATAMGTVSMDTKRGAWQVKVQLQG